MKIKNNHNQPCQCEICQLLAKVDEAMHSEDIEFIKRTLQDFVERWYNADMERDINQAIINGEWPGSKEILTEGLKKAKERL